MMENLYAFMVAHWLLWTALVTLAICLLAYEGWELRKQAKQLSPQEAVLLMNHEDAIILDIRPAPLFQKGHILNALHTAKDESPEALLKKYKNKPLILVCQRGITAQDIGMKWQKAGLSHLRVLAGGMEAWQRDGLPVVSN